MDLAGGIIRSSTVARSSRWRVRLTSAPQPARASWGASHGFAGWRAEVWAAFWRNAARLSGTSAHFGPESFRFCCGKVWVLSFIVPDLFIEASLIPLGYLVHFWLLGLLPPRVADLEESSFWKGEAYFSLGVSVKKNLSNRVKPRSCFVLSPLSSWARVLVSC